MFDMASVIKYYVIHISYNKKYQFYLTIFIKFVTQMSLTKYITFVSIIQEVF